MEFKGLGYGEQEEILCRIPNNGLFVVIRDDDAATSGMPDCWFYTPCSNTEMAIGEYEKSGGTASTAFTVEINKR